MRGERINNNSTGMMLSFVNNNSVSHSDRNGISLTNKTRIKKEQKGQRTKYPVTHYCPTHKGLKYTRMPSITTQKCFSQKFPINMADKNYVNVHDG